METKSWEQGSSGLADPQRRSNHCWSSRPCSCPLCMLLARHDRGSPKDDLKMAPFSTQPHIFYCLLFPLHFVFLHVSHKSCCFSPGQIQRLCSITTPRSHSSCNCQHRKSVSLLRSLQKVSEIPSKRIVPHRRDYYSGK